jgi:hypothetical protein
MVADGWSLGRMAKRLGVAKRSLQRWRSTGSKEQGTLKHELYMMLQPPPSLGFVDSEDKPETKPQSFEEPLLAAKRNREMQPHEIAQSMGVSLDDLIQHGATTYIIDPQGEQSESDFLNPEDKIRSWGLDD